MESDCEDKLAKNSRYYGEAGNLCHVDCSNQGICDFSSGTCQCFDGQYGLNCNTNSPSTVYDIWNKPATNDDF